MNAKKKTAAAPKAVDTAPRIVAGVGVAVGSDVSTPARKERKRLLEEVLQNAVLDTIAESDRQGNGFPSDAILRQAQADALKRFKQEH